MSKAGLFLVAQYSDFGKPAELATIPAGKAGSSGEAATDGRDSSDDVQLTRSVPAEFMRSPWVIPEIVHFRARDGKSIPAMIYKPLDFSAARKYPVVVFVHGAGYLQNVYRGWSYYYREYMFHHQLTQLGFVVF